MRLLIRLWRGYHYVVHFPNLCANLRTRGVKLGTKPPMNSVMKQVRELDYDLVESEHRALLQVTTPHPPLPTHPRRGVLFIVFELSACVEIGSVRVWCQYIMDHSRDYFSCRTFPSASFDALRTCTASYL
jgi:hypothetical protein